MIRGGRGMADTDVEERRFRIYLFEHKVTGLQAAFSDDLHGLVVHGRSEDEIREKLPGAIRDLVDAHGMEVVSLTVDRDDRLADYRPPMFIANAAVTGPHRDA